jgi:hypothetical protein
MATVLVVNTESTLQKSAVDALVLTAANISLEDARIASTIAIQLSLATVEWRSIAIFEARQASEEASTGVSGIHITIANSLADEVASFRINSIAVHQANANTTVLGSSLTTVAPITVVIDAGVRRALVNSALPIKSCAVVVLRADGITSSTRKCRAVHAFANSATRSLVEDAITKSEGGALASVDFTTVSA